MTVNNNRAQGRKAKRNGQVFESLLERSCIYYKKMGIAHIQKTPEPMRIIAPISRGKGQYKAIFEKKAQPDFTGTLSNGKSIVFEAKNTDSTNLPFDRINDVQESDLSYHAHLGAKCLVVISFNMKRFYAVPWNKWMHMKKSGKKKSVNELDLVDYAISTEKGILDFLKRYENG